MPLLKLAVATRCFRMPILDSLTAVRDLSVSGVQLDLGHELPPESLSESGRRQLLHRISELDLKISGAAFPNTPLLLNDHNVDRQVESLCRAMTFAYSINATTLCCRLGKIPENRESRERNRLVEILGDLARHGNHVGTVFCLTPTNDSAEDLKSLVDEIKSGPLGIDFDPAHFAMTGRSSIEAFRLLHRDVRHFQLRDGLRDFSGGSQESPVGQGTIDWPTLLALLAEADYSGWVTAIRTQGDSIPRDLARSIEYIRDLLPGV
ncbi:MAG: sugar phosphate isomerase/epimerase [Planctomycetes bacterium]|nr:sugar phosphate isomerase/epimerase [Planctomycetota bacterium]